MRGIHLAEAVPVVQRDHATGLGVEPQRRGLEALEGEAVQVAAALCDRVHRLHRALPPAH